MPRINPHHLPLHLCPLYLSDCRIRNVDQIPPNIARMSRTMAEDMEAMEQNPVNLAKLGLMEANIKALNAHERATMMQMMKA
ncbi:hypothetical protein COP2_030393 [Malus domestica]